jgi:anti-anti-sigma regulatory factor
MDNERTHRMMHSVSTLLTTGGRMATTLRQRPLNLELAGEVRIVTFVDSVLQDDETINLIGSDLLHLLELGYKKIILDFLNVTFLAEEMLGKLMSFRRHAKEVHAQVILCALGNTVEEKLRTTRLIDCFTIMHDRAAALAAFEDPVTPIFAPRTSEYVGAQTTR